MNKSKVLIVFISLLYLLFLIFEFSGESILSKSMSSLILPIITLLYFATVKRRTLFFSLFLICYSLSDLMTLIVDYVPHKVDYFIGNSLYILAYLFLLIEIAKSMSLTHVIRNFKIHILVLVALNVYIVYVMQVIVNPHVQTSEYYVELLYNTVMLLLLSIALLNYIYRDNKKSLYLFLGSLSIVFSEVISVAYIYVSDKSLLNFLSITLAVIAFYFFFQQSKMRNRPLKALHMVTD